MAGLEEGAYCYCGSTYATLTRKDEKDCSKTCPKDQINICESSNSLSVYKGYLGEFRLHNNKWFTVVSYSRTN